MTAFENHFTCTQNHVTVGKIEFSIDLETSGKSFSLSLMSQKYFYERYKKQNKRKNKNKNKTKNKSKNKNKTNKQTNIKQKDFENKRQLLQKRPTCIYVFVAFTVTKYYFVIHVL